MTLATGIAIGIAVTCFAMAGFIFATSKRIDEQMVAIPFMFVGGICGIAATVMAFT